MHMHKRSEKRTKKNNVIFNNILSKEARNEKREAWTVWTLTKKNFLNLYLHLDWLLEVIEIKKKFIFKLGFIARSNLNKKEIYFLNLRLRLWKKRYIYEYNVILFSFLSLLSPIFLLSFTLLLHRIYFLLFFWTVSLYKRKSDRLFPL